MPMTGQGGQSGGPQYGWGGVGNDPGAGSRAESAGSRTNFNSGLHNAGPQAGIRRGEWQSQGHGPSAQRDYARDYDRGFRGQEGGNGRGQYDHGFRAAGGFVGGSGNRTGGFRGGVAPAFGGQYGIGNEYADRYDRELRARDSRGYGQYDNGYRAQGGPGFGGGHRTGGQYDDGYRAAGGQMGSGAGPRYGADFGGGYGGQMGRGGNQEVTYGFGSRQSSGGYGARQGGGYEAGGRGQRGGYGREFGQGRALSGRGGGYDAGYAARPLTDDEFYSRVSRW